MTLKLHVPEKRDLRPRLTVFGVGGAGGNAVNNMIARSLDGVDFVVANTDAQALSLNEAAHKVQLGEELTEGLGAGAKPEIGARAAEESIERITDLLLGSHMCFITAGMGGGTGTGAAPIIAQAARQLGILTVGVVTKPFQFEGSRRMKQAEEGIEELQQYVDTLIVIPNQNLFRLANESTTFTEAFGMADDVLYQGVKGVTDLMVKPGLVNLDFADIRSVMDEMGKAMMGTGEAEGDDRAVVAAERAIANPLLDEISLQGAHGVLINITGGDDMSLYEVDEASNKIREQVDAEANIIFGATRDPDITGKIRVSVVATGIDAEHQNAAKPNGRRSVAAAEAEALEEDNMGDLFEQPAESVEAPAATAAETIAEPFEAEREAVFEAPVTKEAAKETAPAFEEVAQAPIAPQEAAQEPSHAAKEQQAEMVYEPTPVAPQAPREAPVMREEPAAPIAASTNTQDEKRARLQAAVERRQPAAPVADRAPERPARFSIDSVIKRMTRQDVEPAERPVASREPAPNFDRSNAAPKPEYAQRPALASPTAAPTAAPARSAELNPEENKRVDIPAFLRRQAN